MIVLSGALEEGCGKLYTMGVTAMFSCSDGTHSQEWQLEHAREALAFAADQLLARWRRRGENRSARARIEKVAEC